jgi:hypothetical protein
MSARSELIESIRKIEPTFDPASRSDSYLAGYFGTLNARRTDSVSAPAPQTAQRCEARDERIDSAPAAGGWLPAGEATDGDPAELARERMLQKRADAAKRTGLPDFTSTDPEAAAVATSAPAKREDEDPDAARERSIARRAEAATKTGFPWQT